MNKKKKDCCPNFSDFTALFKALGDSNRMTIFNRIFRCFREEEGSVNVGEVSSCCDVDISGVSRHLSILKEAGVLTARKQGKEVFYSIQAKELARRLREMADLLDSCQTNERRNSNE